MFRIFKYPFEVKDIVEIRMPQGAHILTVQAQAGVPCIWATVDDEQPLETRSLRLFGTGHSFEVDPLRYRYIGTFQLLGGELVGHLFELVS